MGMVHLRHPPDIFLLKFDLCLGNSLNLNSYDFLTLDLIPLGPKIVDTGEKMHHKHLWVPLLFQWVLLMVF